MRNKFNDLESFYKSDWYKELRKLQPEKQNRVLKSPRLENEIYSDLSTGDEYLKDICENGSKLLPTFESLARDVFTGFYSLSPKFKDESEISHTAKNVNKPIIVKTMADEEFIALKSICEGRELQSYDASVEFSEKISERLSELLDSLPKSKTLDTLNKQVDELKRKLRKLCGDKSSGNLAENKILRIANRLFSKEKQISDLQEKANDDILKAAPKVKEAVKIAIEAAKKKAIETDNLIHAWGDDPENPQTVKANGEMISKIRRNPKLLEISRIMGRYIKMIADKRKNSFEYGLGEKYDITQGKNISLCLSSELALLGSPELQLLFTRKYMGGKLKQYRKREPEVNGRGDIIVCVDESASMMDLIQWAKALSFALLDIIVIQVESNDKLRPRYYRIE